MGPLTNIGLLFAIDPEIPKLLKRWVLMGGVYVSRPAMYGLTEWNIIGDPHASAIAFAAPVAEVRCIGLDVTTRCTLAADEFRKRFSQGPLRIVLDMAEVWFKNRQQVIFHDPLAAVTVFEPDLCKYQQGLVTIELQSERLRGMTLFDRSPQQKPHQIAIDVDPDRFFNRYFATLRT